MHKYQVFIEFYGYGIEFYGYVYFDNIFRIR